MIDDCCLYDHGSRQRPLTDASGPEVHVLGARVQLRVALHRVVRHHLDRGFSLSKPINWIKKTANQKDRQLVCNQSLLLRCLLVCYSQIEDLPRCSLCAVRTTLATFNNHTLIISPLKIILTINNLIFFLLWLMLEANLSIQENWIILLSVTDAWIWVLMFDQ